MEDIRNRSRFTSNEAFRCRIIGDFDKSRGWNSFMPDLQLQLGREALETSWIGLLGAWLRLGY
jgi:hypothetical protein